MPWLCPPPSGEDPFHKRVIRGVIPEAMSEEVTFRELDESPPNWWWPKWLCCDGWPVFFHSLLLSPACSDGIKESSMLLTCNRRQGCLLFLMYLSSDIFWEFESRNTWGIISLSDTLRKSSIRCFSVSREPSLIGVLFLLTTKLWSSCPCVTTFLLTFWKEPKIVMCSTLGPPLTSCFLMCKMGISNSLT